MSSGLLPIPSIKFIPKAAQADPDAGWIALTDKLDSIWQDIENVILELRYFLNPERIPSQFLDVFGLYLEAGIFPLDDDKTKRSKIQYAVQSHKLRGTWDFDVKTKIDIIAGGDSQIVSTGHEDNFDFIWLTGDSSEYHAETQHSLWDSGNEGYGMLWITGDNEPEVAGNIYSDVDNPYMTEQQIEALILFLQDSIASYLNTWLGFFFEWVSKTSGTTNNLYGIVFSGTQYVAVGASGIILSSLDTETWTQRDTGTNIWHDVFFGGNLFVTVGTSGTIKTSPNTITWTSRTSGISDDLNGIIYAENIYVAAGDSGKIITSPDAITWTTRTSGISDDLNGIWHNGVAFLAVGKSGKIIISASGINWIPNASGTTENFNDITFGNGVSVAVGENDTIRISGEIPWKSASTGIGTSLYSIDYDIARNLFIIIADSGKIITSKNLIDWTLGDTMNTITNKIRYGNKKHIAVGNSGFIADISFNKVYLA